jgi:hypothetical protein
MTKRLFAIAICLFAAILFDPRGLQAADGTVALQIKPLAMPAVTDKGYKGRMTMTPYVVVTDAKAVARLCGRLPRLLDAVLLAFEDNPVALSDPAADMAGRQDVLRTLTDETIGTGVFAAFYLVPGSVERGEGTEMIEVPGGVRECQPIRELPWIVQETAAKQQRAVSASEAVTSVMPSPSSVSGEAIAPSPLTEEQLLKAEAELNAEQPIRKPFPGAPPGARSDKEMPVKVAIIVAGIGGLMMVIGSYIGYQVAKIRGERRRQERRKARRDRRAGVDRRRRSDGPPSTGERRLGEDRRKLDERRKAEDRRSKRDRRAETEEQPGDEN